jgi:Fe-S cluster biogenesis protein NfuA
VPEEIKEDEDLRRALERVLAPLVEADHGELYWIRGSGPVRLHLRGRFSGCPGNALVTANVIRPLIAAACPNREVVVTSGALLPSGAERVSVAAS